MRVPESWRHPTRWGVRARSALAAMAVVAVAVGVAAAALLVVLQLALAGAADDAATGRARDVAAALRTTDPAGLDPALLSTDARTTAVQVLDGDGTVVARSPGAPTTPLAATRPATGATVAGVRVRTPSAELRVAAAGAGGGQTVLVAANQEPIETTTRTVGALLALGAPVIVLVVGWLTQALVGRSLRSVDRIRARVAAVSAHDLTGRVPVPTARDEVAELAETMNAMLARLEAATAAQRRFVGDASHELRSPLATVTTALELASSRPEVLDAALVEGTLLPEAHRMSRLVDDLLLLARADERGLPAHRTDVDLDDVADGVLTRLEPPRPGTTVVRDLGPARLSGDPAQLGRVVRNLVENAQRHARAQVRVRTGTEGGAVLLAVDDDGPGIPVAERGRVLQRFVRLEEDRGRETGGSGLGLAIVAEIVEAHGGTVDVGGSALGGAQVCVRLPAG
ncbi:ATP-binding protein [Rhodococcus aerolatus]